MADYRYQNTPHTVQQQDEAADAQTTDARALLETMRTRFREAEEWENVTRLAELEDVRFAHGEQWPQDIAHRRRLDNRPCLTINQMPQHIRQVTNEQRQNRPAIRVIPVDDYADQRTAEIFQGIIRHIEVDSKADIAYTTAFEQAVKAGRGYFRIVTEYVDEMSFDLAIKIKRIRNRFTVYLDPSSQEIDGSDAEWGMIVSRVNRDVFRQAYPDALAGNMASWTSEGDAWVTATDVRVVEYFYRDHERRRIVQLSDGTVHEARALTITDGVVQEDRRSLEGESQSPRRVVQERTALFPTVHWVKSNGYTILEQGRFPGRYIPIIPVTGDEVDIEGRIRYEGMTRHGKDAARMYNYWASSETETIALAPRAPYIGYRGQFEGHEDLWQAANQQNIPWLEVNPVTDEVTGAVLPLPQRQVWEPPVQAITNARLMARDDIKATTGIYDASLGARSNETSGRAILAREAQGETTNFHYDDNLSWSLRYAGQVLISMIPELYHTRRIVRIMGEDNEARQVTINAPFVDEKGIEQFYDVRVGRYDVVVETGPSFATKRRETVGTMLELSRIYPQIVEIAGDLLVKNMDWPGAQEVAKRLQKLLPPEFQPADDEMSPQDELDQLRAAVPQLQAQLEQLNAYSQQMEAQVQEATQEHAAMQLQLQNKAGELALKREEAQAKALVEQEKVLLDQQEITIKQQELELKTQELALEVVKVQQETGRDIAQEITQAAQTSAESRELSAQLLAQQQQLADALATIQELQEAALARQDREISIERQPDGRMVGIIQEPGQPPRRVERSE